MQVPEKYRFVKVKSEPSVTVCLRVCVCPKESGNQYGRKEARAAACTQE